MFTINDDLSIHATRGDTVFFTVMAEENGTPYFFEAGDVLRMKIYQKKNANNVVLEKNFPVTARTDKFTILLTEEDTKIGDVISKATDYWYEIELNPFTNPQTIIGYDEDGAKLFRLFPEGADSDVPETDPEDIPVVDIELDMTSNRPVQNQAISRAIVNLEAAYQVTKEEVEKKAQETSNFVSNMGAVMNASVANMGAELATERARIDNIVSGATADDAEVIDIRVGDEGEVYDSAGTSIRQQISRVSAGTAKPSLYDLNVVREHLGVTDLCAIDSLVGVVTDASRTWQYVHKTIRLPVGRYTAIIRDMKLSTVGSFSIKGTPTALFFLQEVNEPGIYVFDVYDDGTNYDENAVTIMMQISTAKSVDVGTYYVNGISIFEGDITKEPVFPDYITGTNTKLEKVLGKNLFDKNKVTYGVFLTANGQEFTNEYSSDYYVSDFIEAQPSTMYALTDYNIGGAHICFYNSSYQCVGCLSGTLENDNDRLIDSSGVFTTPADCVYIRISGYIENIATNQLEHGDRITEYNDYTEYAPVYENTKRIENVEKILELSDLNGSNTNSPLSESIDTMADGDSISISSPNAKNHNSIGFDAAITIFDKLVISHGKTNPYCSAYIVIDPTSVNVYHYPSAEALIDTFTHGLNISDFISVNIRVGGGSSAKLSIVTASGVFTQDITWNGSNGDIVVESVGSELTNCTLNYFVNGLKKDVWLFGDSYFDFWPNKIVERGYENFYIDGYSGRNSAAALASLNACLTYRKPKTLAWFMGMNDADNGAVNSSWYNAYTALADICESYGIELVLATVPNVPERDHSYKNAIIRGSGYRYIDVCKAVGADISTGWLNGLLSGDNVHPTSYVGAEFIANYIANNFPEILN